MLPDETTQRTLRELLLRISLGKASEADEAQYCELVLHNASARKYAVTLLYQFAALEAIGAMPLKGESTAELPVAAAPRRENLCSPAPLVPVPARPPLGVINSWGAIAAAFAIGILSTLVALRVGSDQVMPVADLPRPPSPVQPIQPAERFVARLVSNTGTVWSQSEGHRLEKGGRLKVQETIGLQEGVAQLEFDNGLTIHLEGPAAISVDGSGVPALHYGQLVAAVFENKATCRIDTELGSIHLSAGEKLGILHFGRELQIHPFVGEGVFTAPNEDPIEMDGLRSYIVLVGPTGAHRVLTQRPAPHLFSVTQGDRIEALEVDPRYGELVRAAEPIAYWNFDKIHDGRIPNQIGSRYTLRAEGALRTQRQGANHALRFGLGNEAGYVRSEDTFDELAASDYTIECLILPERYYTSSLISLCRERTDEEEESQGIILELIGNRSHSKRSKSIRFLHRSPPGSDSKRGTSLFSPAPYRVNVWQHLAAVREGNTLRLYLDGKLVATDEDPAPMFDNLTLVMGQLYTFASIRPYVGLIDELAIYDKALSIEEFSARCQLAGIDPEAE